MGASESACMWRAHVSTSSRVRTWGRVGRGGGGGGPGCVWRRRVWGFESARRQAQAQAVAVDRHARQPSPAHQKGALADAGLLQDGAQRGQRVSQHVLWCQVHLGHHEEGGHFERQRHAQVLAAHAHHPGVGAHDHRRIICARAGGRGGGPGGGGDGGCVGGARAWAGVRACAAGTAGGWAGCAACGVEGVGARVRMRAPAHQAGGPSGRRRWS